jgi:hypothetical protein
VAHDGAEHVKKSNILVVLMLLHISSCDTEDSINQNVQVNDNLTGTWISKSVEETFDNPTNQLSSNTVYSTVYITESDADIQISACEYYSNTFVAPITLIKKNNLLESVGIVTEPYSIVSPNELTRIFVISSSTSTTSYNQTLTKASSTINMSRGSLQLDGPISANNQNHVCVVQRFGTDPAQGSNLNVIIPFDDDILNLDIIFSKPLSTGDYQYVRSVTDGSNDLSNFGIYSNSNIFWSLLGTNGLFPNLANLTITNSQPEFIEGDFSFIGLDGNNYTGSFSATPY